LLSCSAVAGRRHLLKKPEEKMNFDRKYLVWSLCFAALGMGLGIFMAASHNHGELTTHAHILLVGFVVSFIYGMIHKLWLTNPNRAVATFQFILHQAAAILVSVGLFLLYGAYVPEDKLEPFLASGSVGILLAMLLMLYMVIRSGSAKTPA
jgi:hypothetical protein